MNKSGGGTEPASPPRRGGGGAARSQLSPQKRLQTGNFPVALWLRPIPGNGPFASLKKPPEPSAASPVAWRAGVFQATWARPSCPGLAFLAAVLLAVAEEEGRAGSPARRRLLLPRGPLEGYRPPPTPPPLLLLLLGKSIAPSERSSPPRPISHRASL